MVEQWSSKSHVWVRFLLPLLMKYRFYKHKYGHIRLFNKKRSKIVNLNKKILKKKFKPIFNYDYLEHCNYYKIAKLSTAVFNNNKIFNNNRILFFNKFFNNNKIFNLPPFFSLITRHTFKNSLFNFYNYNFKNKFLFYNIFMNLFSNAFFYNFFYKYNCNFGYLYLYYLNNSNFLTKTRNSYYSYFGTRDNLIFPKYISSKSKNKITYRKFKKNYLNSSSSFTFFNMKSLNFLNFLKKFNFKVFFSNYRFKLNRILVRYPSFYIYFFCNFHYKNLFTPRVKNRELDIFKLMKTDWVNINLARLTRSSFKFDHSDIFNFKFFYLNFTETNVLSLINSFISNDSLLENNFFFLNTFFNLNVRQDSFFKNDYYFLNALDLNDYIKTNSIDYFYFINKLKKVISPLSVNFYTYKSSLIDNFSSLSDNFFKLNKLEAIFFIFFNPILFKYTFFTDKKNYTIIHKSFKNILFTLVDSFFYSHNSNFKSTNLLPDLNFSFILKKKMLKIFSYSKFSITTVLWQYNTLLRFLEFCSGRKVCLKFFNFLGSTLNFSEKAQCLLWSQKVKYFRKVLGPRLFLNESLQIMFLALKLKDPFFLSNWMVSTMYKISFWKYKMFLRYLKYVLRYFFWVIFKDLNIKGIKFQLKGKISVAGNARTRTVFHNVGFTSHTTFNNKILYHLNLVRSFTGVMGLKLWIVF